MDVLLPPGWPRPSGYAHGVVATGRVIFVAGQIGTRADGALVAPDLVAQVAQALRNVLAVLGAGGAAAEHVTRLTWYVADLAEYRRSREALGSAYREVMGRHFPAMSVVAVAGLLEPGARVEIEATAVVPA